MGTTNSIGFGQKINTYQVSPENMGKSFQKKSEEVSGFFSSFMSQYQSSLSKTADEGLTGDHAFALENGNGQMDYAKTAFVSGGQTNISRSESAKTRPGELEEAESEMEEFAENVISEISQELDVSEEDVMIAMEEMGLSVLDLLNPQNLGNLVMELVGMDDSTQLLLDANFQNLVADIGQLGEELMENLGLKQEELTQLMGQMEILEEPLTLDELPAEERNDLAIHMEAGNQEEMPEDNMEVSKQDGEPDMVADAQEPDETAELAEESRSRDSGQEFSNQRQSAAAEQSRETAMNPLQSNSQVEFPAQEPLTERITSEVSYTSVNTAEIIDQIVENTRSMVQNGVATVEMQLNPENLGRILLNVTSREGVVNAQLTATSEAVRAALEVQLADLRENLNQAGIKVDAVEVTVSSHGFEENLEQNARQEEEMAAEQAKQSRGRRNLILDALDELSGIMTEEEELAAQIMRDNGNTMDVIA